MGHKTNGLDGMNNEQDEERNPIMKSLINLRRKNAEDKLWTE